MRSTSARAYAPPPRPGQVLVSQDVVDAARRRSRTCTLVPDGADLGQGQARADQRLRRQALTNARGSSDDSCRDMTGVAGWLLRLPLGLSSALHGGKAACDRRADRSKARSDFVPVRPGTSPAVLWRRGRRMPLALITTLAATMASPLAAEPGGLVFVNFDGAELIRNGSIRLKTTRRATRAGCTRGRSRPTATTRLETRGRDASAARRLGRLRHRAPHRRAPERRRSTR